MQFPEDISQDVIHRLRRVEGQIRGLEKLVEQRAECRDIVIQLAAAKAALDRVGFKLVAAGIKHCAVSDAPTEDVAQLEALFMKLS